MNKSKNYYGKEYYKKYYAEKKLNNKKQHDNYSIKVCNVSIHINN